LGDPSVPSVEVVGAWWKASASCLSPFDPPAGPRSGSVPRCISDARGVGQSGNEPESLAAVRGTNIGRGVQTPFRIEPEVGKIGEDVREPVLNKSGDVLQEHASRSHVTDDPSNGRPEPPVIVNSTALTCSGERLARESRSDEIHASTPRCAIEGCEIVPDRSAIQSLFFHPGHENGRRVGVPLNTSHGSYSVLAQGKLEASVAVTETEGT
jgi:hypothetical protein